MDVCGYDDIHAAERCGYSGWEAEGDLETGGGRVHIGWRLTVARGGGAWLSATDVPCIPVRHILKVPWDSLKS